MNYKLNEMTKWYTSKDYLEIFHPKLRNILAIKKIGIDIVWKQIFENEVKSFKNEFNDDYKLELINILLEKGIIENENV